MIMTMAVNLQKTKTEKLNRITEEYLISNLSYFKIAAPEEF